MTETQEVQELGGTVEEGPGEKEADEAGEQTSTRLCKGYALLDDV